jgi:hypothetical protein
MPDVERVLEGIGLSGEEIEEMTWERPRKLLGME